MLVSDPVALAGWFRSMNVPGDPASASSPLIDGLPTESVTAEAAPTKKKTEARRSNEVLAVMSDSFLRVGIRSYPRKMTRCFIPDGRQT
jgi:hypothetical protein